MFEEALENPMFYILAAIGLGGEILGYTMSKKAGWVVMPFWQLAVMMLVTLIACVYFANQD